MPCRHAPLFCSALVLGIAVTVPLAEARATCVGTLTAPPNATWVTSSPTLTWTSTGCQPSFNVQMATDTAFTQNRIESGWVPATSYTFAESTWNTQQASAWTYATTVYWRIQGRDAPGGTIRSSAKRTLIMDPDVDDDGWSIGQGDCADTDASRSPGAAELCDGIDNDCDGTADDGVTYVYQYLDSDGDGYGNDYDAVYDCQPLAGRTQTPGDCNDSDPSFHPGQAETCDGLDQDCDGSADDGLEFWYQFLDADGDGYGNPYDAVVWCSALPGRVVDFGDCADGDAAVHPGQAEVCDGIDQDCDGTADDGLWFTYRYQDADADGYGNPYDAVVWCLPVEGRVEDGSDCDDGDESIHPGRAEVCDGIDQDCDGAADDGLWFTYLYQDADADGYGNPYDAVVWCLPLEGRVEDGSDCHDGDASIHPDQAEACDGIDQDCDGTADDGLPYTLKYLDGDGDGYGNPYDAVSWCLPVEGRVEDGTDCDDTNAAVHPGEHERTNSRDDDCDGAVDEDVDDTWYQDLDGDGAGSDNRWYHSPGHVNCDDPADPNMYPVRVCEYSCFVGLDNYCWHGCNEAYEGNYSDVGGYGDLNGDGDAGDCFTDWSGPPDVGWVPGSDDCDDSDPTSYLGAEEVCDGYDNDCDGTVDDGFVVKTWYRDADGDGFGWDDPGTNIASCAAPEGQGYAYVDVAGDCSDAFADDYPGAPELCDARDNDCDGASDDGFDLLTFYLDSDGDGFDGSDSLVACAGLQGAYATVPGPDCDDSDPSIHPGATDTCGNEVDEDCDGETSCGRTGFSTAESADVRIVGSRGYQLGWGWPESGDLSGDGTPDLLATAAGVSRGRGGLYAMEGPVAPGATLQQAFLKVVGASPQQRVGYAARPLPGGGLAVAAYGAQHQGAVYGWGGPLPQGTFGVSTADFSVAGDSPDDAAVAVEPLPDLDGGGDPWIAVGAPGFEDVAWLTDPGWVDLYTGYLAGDLGVGYGDVVFYGEQAGDRAGASVRQGDVDGDGLVDLLITAPGEVIPSGGTGAAHVCYGDALWGAGSLSDLCPDAVVAGPLVVGLGGAEANAAALADLDGDGTDDLLLPTDPPGDLYVCLGPIAGQVNTESCQLGVVPVDSGFDRARAADLDGDAALDLVVTGTTQSGLMEGGALTQGGGTVLVLYEVRRFLSGPGQVWLGPESFDWVIAGGEVDEHCGYSLDLVDLGGSPNPDVVLGCPNAGSQDGGAIQIFLSQ